MSIFHKDCPQCAAPNAVHTNRCPCGYFFDPQAYQDKDTAAQLALHERRLYHDYLAARVVQAEALLEVARTDAQADPENLYKAAQALAAEQSLNTVRAELRAHAVPVAPPAATNRQSGAVANKSKAAPKANAKPVKSSRSVRAPRVATEVSPPVTAPTPAPAPLPAPIGPTIAIAVATLPNPPMAESPPAVPSPNRSANTTFRARQAARAEQITATAAVTIAAAAPRPAAKLLKRTTGKECPNCTAAVPPTANRCRCGYHLSRGPSLEMPPLLLDEGAQAILAGRRRSTPDRS